MVSQGSQPRLRELVEAGIALSSELSLDAVLRRLVEAAAQLTGARYAALGVIDQAGRGLERFVATGLDDKTIREIGDLPLGRGILGVLIREATPLRLHDLTEDPRSVGFPPGHPPMRSFLGVPLLLRGVAYGNLYLTEKEGGEDFTDGDQEVVQLLAAQAAVAIENARLYQSAMQWARQLETLTEIGNALSSETDLPSLLRLIASRLRELVGARFVFIALRAAEGELRIEAAADHRGVEEVVGLSMPKNPKSDRVLARRRSERIDSMIDDPEIDHGFMRQLAELAKLPMPTATLFVPLLARDRAIGMIAIHDRVGQGGSRDLHFTDADLRLAEVFAERAAIAVDLSQRIQRDAFRRVVDAQELERKRLARELHDETGQALTSILLGLRTVEDAGSDDARREAAANLREIAVTTLQDVRRLAVELRPTTLDDFGLVPALERLVDGFREQTGMTVHYDAGFDDRLPGEVETALYRIVQEALTNVMKHARAETVRIVIVRSERTVSATVEDDGVGFDPHETREDGLGLVGMRERLALINGTLSVVSIPGSGTTITAQVPVP